jgi:stage II sporulation protein D
MLVRVLVVCLLGLTSTVLASPAGHDAADLLYSSQLSFDSEGTPKVTVGIMEGQREVVLSCSKGLTIRLSGPADTQVDVPAGHRIRLSGYGQVPGETHYRVVLTGLRGGNLSAISDVRRTWGDRDVHVEEISIGGIVGFPSRILDNRRSLLVTKTIYSSREEAEVAAQGLTETWKLKSIPRVFGQPLKRSKGTLLATDLKSGLVIRQADLISFVGGDSHPITVEQVEFGKGYAHHSFEDRRFRGEIVVAIDSTGRLAVVNRLSAEHVLQGIVPSEIFPTAPPAALEAQAIAARSELFAKIGIRNLADPFLVCATQRCQVYGGINKETVATNKAVQRTRGMMLFDANEHLVDAVYSASSGGHTESNEHVWEGSPNPTLRGKFDGKKSNAPWPKGKVPTIEQLTKFIDDPPWTYAGNTTKGRKVFRWVKVLPTADMDSLVNKRHKIGHVTALQVLERGVSGRAKRVLFQGTEGEVVVKGELKIRRLLGNMRSSMFITSFRDGHWFFKGGGWGHGVGMCQYGAIGMAEAGKSATKILRTYFSGTKVNAVY